MASRGIHGTATRQTKGKRPRSVLIGPRLSAMLSALQDAASEPIGWLLICPRPARGRYAHRPAGQPPHCKTVHDWHERTLAPAGICNMPLHALRHTTSAAWLSTGHSLLFVTRQLGHRSITTTEQRYGHLELNPYRDALARTDDAIRAPTRPRADRRTGPRHYSHNRAARSVGGSVAEQPLARRYGAPLPVRAIKGFFSD